MGGFSSGPQSAVVSGSTPKAIPVELTGSSAVTLGAGAEVALASGSAVRVSLVSGSLFEVALGAGAAVAVGNTPNVSVTNTPNVAVTNTPTVIVDAGNPISGSVKLVDEAGTEYGVRHYNNRLRVSTNTYGYDVASGSDSNVAFVNKFGSNPAVGATDVTIWGAPGRYTWATASATLRVGSDNAADDSAGTGARTVSVYGLDGSYNEQVEQVTLDGDAGGAGNWVLTTGSFLRAHRVVVETAGSDGFNQGLLEVKNQGDEFTLAIVDPGNNRTLVAVYTVPNGKKLFVTQIAASEIGSQGAELKFFVRPLNGVFQLKQYLLLNGTTVTRRLDIPLVYAAKTDIEMAGKRTGAVNAHIEATFQGYLETV